MQFLNLQVIADSGKSFTMSGLSGSLYFESSPSCIQGDKNSVEWSLKIKNAIDFCNEPYTLCASSKRVRQFITGVSRESNSRMANVANRLIQLSKQNFFLSRLYASWRRPFFDNAAEAIAFFRHDVSGDQAELCLPRSLFAATTSKKFADSGVILIGVFLPARALHAWVIEGNEVADPFDDIWINYKPIAILS
jgi:hypothetical protein